jgi:hypothetical protein
MASYVLTCRKNPNKQTNKNQISEKINLVMDFAIFREPHKIINDDFLNLYVNILKDPYLLNWTAKYMLKKKLTYSASYNTYVIAENYLHVLDIVKFRKCFCFI